MRTRCSPQFSYLHLDLQNSCQIIAIPHSTGEKMGLEGHTPTISYWRTVSCAYICAMAYAGLHMESTAHAHICTWNQWCSHTPIHKEHISHINPCTESTAHTHTWTPKHIHTSIHVEQHSTIHTSAHREHTSCAHICTQSSQQCTHLHTEPTGHVRTCTHATHSTCTHQHTQNSHTPAHRAHSNVHTCT